jgi:tRNA pseudouridine55 synthase
MDKPAGLTSFGLVERIRRWSRIRKVGHTGTLDPFATGLLVLCLGRATRLAPYITDWDKEYEGEIRLGVETDTDDATGRVTFGGPAEGVARERLEEGLGRFRGTIQQTPPQFSAKKKGGIPSYRLARKGEHVDLAPVTVTIHALDLLAVDGDLVRVRVRCAKGTYMRSLARDLGRYLGCGAHLKSLRRTAIGALRVGDALSLDAVADRRGPQLDELLWPVERVLADWREVPLDLQWRRQVRHGQDVPLTAGGAAAESVPEGEYVRLTGEGGALLAVGRVVPGASGPMVHPELVWDTRRPPLEGDSSVGSEVRGAAPGAIPQQEVMDMRTIAMEDETCR